MNVFLPFKFIFLMLWTFLSTKLIGSKMLCRGSRVGLSLGNSKNEWVNGFFKPWVLWKGQNGGDAPWVLEQPGAISFSWVDLSCCQSLECGGASMTLWFPVQRDTGRGCFQLIWPSYWSMNSYRFCGNRNSHRSFKSNQVDVWSGGIWRKLT